MARLVEILKSSSPSLQEKAASVLEFVALSDPTMVSIISVDIESALNDVFQQKILKISGLNFFSARIYHKKLCCLVICLFI